GVGRAGAECLVRTRTGLAEPSGEHRYPFLNDVADEVAEHAPVHERVDVDRYLHGVSAAPVFIAMKTEVRDLAGEHRGARALAAFRVGAAAEHRVAVDHRGRLHP